MKKQYKILLGIVIFLAVGLGIYLVFFNKACNMKIFNQDDEVVAYKPNIYVYPEKKSQLSFQLSFPQGGKIIQSIPEYKENWNVNVDPSGLIDAKYRYLFYESTQADVWQRKSGYVVAKDSLLTFFKSNMELYGFSAAEIRDFTAYWIPRFKDKKFYIIYPQEKEIVEKAIVLHVSEKVTQLQRLHYLILGSDSKDKLIKKHQVKSNFKRKGFYITEWGVLL